MRILNGVTEGLDLVNSLYDALPEKIKRDAWFRSRKQEPSPKNKMKLLYEHWREVDVEQAIENIIENQIEDFLFGRLGKAAGAARHNLWSQFGHDVRSITSGPAI